MSDETSRLTDRPVPAVVQVAAGGVVGLAITLVVVGWQRFLVDFWPVDASRVGPNLVASVVQWAIVFVVGVLLWPPTRRRIHRFVDAKVATVHARLDHLSAHHQRTQAMLAHIIEHHPDIPPMPEPEEAS